jgi:hypothetical protein
MCGTLDTGRYIQAAQIIYFTGSVWFQRQDQKLEIRINTEPSMHNFLSTNDMICIKPSQKDNKLLLAGRNLH